MPSTKVIMDIHIITDAVTEDGTIIPEGTVVEYRGHVVGGNVLVRWLGQTYIIHPRTTRELRS